MSHAESQSLIMYQRCGKEKAVQDSKQEVISDLPYTLSLHWLLIGSEALSGRGVGFKQEALLRGAAHREIKSGESAMMQSEALLVNSSLKDGISSLVFSSQLGLGISLDSTGIA